MKIDRILVIIILGIVLYLFYEKYKVNINIPKISVLTQDTTEQTQPEETNIQDTVIPNDRKLEYLKTLFSNGCESYEDSNLTDEDYQEIGNELVTLLAYKFSTRQLKCINKIYLINWEDLNDNVGGIAESSQNGRQMVNVIYLPIRSNNYSESLLHETWHCIYYKHYNVFQQRFNEWENIEDYVSEYAATDIAEDIAETGRVFSSRLETTNPKKQIIEDIYKQTY